jgi:hypothetical protein
MRLHIVNGILSISTKPGPMPHEEEGRKNQQYRTRYQRLRSVETALRDTFSSERIEASVQVSIRDLWR